jgi:hypothetical protein
MVLVKPIYIIMLDDLYIKFDKKSKKKHINI